MTRLLAAAALVAALAVVAGSRSAPGRVHAPGLTGTDPSWLCKPDSDAGTRPKPHGLLMVADREPGLPCAQGG